MTTRRALLAGAAAALALPRRARAAEPLVFVTPQGFDPTFIDVMNAVAGGYFAKEGLDPKLIGPPGNAEAFQLVAAGTAQFSYIASLDFIRAVAVRQAPFYGIACISQRTGFEIVSLKEKPVRSGAELKGKTVGVVSVGGLSELLVQIAMAKGGVAKDETNIVVAGNSPGEVDLVRRGRLDAFICNYPVAVTLRRKGEPLEFLPIDSILRAPGLLLFCTRETAEQRPELVSKVLRAFKGSILELLSQPLPPIYQRAAKLFDIPRINDLDTLVWVQQQVSEHQWLAEGRQNLMRNIPALWQGACDGLKALGIADVKDPAQLYTNRFIDEVMRS
jgi:ABC-type nitrate/sulfonate/bicarbonate transport system substrate-binding protein